MKQKKNILKMNLEQYKEYLINTGKEVFINYAKRITEKDFAVIKTACVNNKYCEK